MADEIELLRLVGELIPEPTTDAWTRARAAIEAAKDDDLLISGMERAMRDSRAPARLAGRLGRRRWHVAVRWVAGGAAVLAVGVVALVAVVVPGSGHGSSEGRAVDAAYVVKRVNSALSAAGPGQIAQMMVTINNPAVGGGTTAATTVEEWSYGGRWRAVTYSASGHLVFDEGFSTASVYTVVDYRTRTWARQLRPGGAADLTPNPPGCSAVIGALPLLLQSGLPGGPPAGWQPATVTEALRAAVSCRALAVTGRQRVDGITAIELASRTDSPISETIWVSPGTYLPVRVVIRPPAGGQGPWQTADITWLPPTTQNLARLNVPVPAAFHRTPLAQAVAPITQRIRAWARASTGRVRSRTSP